MFIAYCVISVLYSAMLTFSAITKLQPHPQAVAVIHEVIGVPLGLFPVLAGLELAGALGLLAGIRWPLLGAAAAFGLIIYFVGAMLSHALVGDFTGIWSPVPMLVLATIVLVLRLKAGNRRAFARTTKD